MPTKSNEPAKLKREKELRRYRWVYTRLLEKFSVNQIAEMTGIKASNLSSYGSGEKNPGKTILAKFYKKMSAEIEKLPIKQYDDAAHTAGQSSPMAEDARHLYLLNPTAENLRVVLTSNTMQTMADSNKILAESTLNLTVTNNLLTQKLIDKFDSAGGK